MSRVRLGLLLIEVTVCAVLTVVCAPVYWTGALLRSGFLIWVNRLDRILKEITR